MAAADQTQLEVGELLRQTRQPCMKNGSRRAPALLRHSVQGVRVFEYICVGVRVCGSSEYLVSVFLNVLKP